MADAVTGLWTKATVFTKGLPFKGGLLSNSDLSWLHSWPQLCVPSHRREVNRKPAISIRGTGHDFVSALLLSFIFLCFRVTILKLNLPGNIAIKSKGRNLLLRIFSENLKFTSLFKCQVSNVYGIRVPSRVHSGARGWSWFLSACWGLTTHASLQSAS